MKIHLEFLTPSMHNAGGWKGKPDAQGFNNWLLWWGLQADENDT